jgi:oxygen-dependent protoporphyrinogen oxidase
MFQRIIQPLVGGIYTADPQKLSVSAALPQFVSQEKKYGSLARAAAADLSAVSDRGARYSLFRSPRDGMQSLVTALEQHLPSLKIRKSTSIREIHQFENGWSLLDDNESSVEYDAVICATPASVTARLLEQCSSQLSTIVDSIEHVSTAVVCLGYHRSQVSHPLDAFGCVVPAIENRKILAVSFTNVKFPLRAPKDHILLRVFVGGALQEELANLDDEPMLAMVRHELADVLGVQGEPVTSKIIRWPQKTPQYHLGHLKRLDEIWRLVRDLHGFEIAGNAYRGVGIPQCVRSGWEAADRVFHSLGCES